MEVPVPVIPPDGGPPALQVLVVPGMSEIRPGADLAQAISNALRKAAINVGDGDVVVIASKVVAKSEGRTVAEDSRDGAIAGETVRVLAERVLPDGRVARVVQSRSGPVLANAGVDLSDMPPGSALLLPEDPDGSARRLRRDLSHRLGVRPAVVVTDTSGRPWREGVVDFALGAAGLVCLEDLRGRRDRFGRTLEVTVRAVGDEVAALTDLVRGKAAGTPVAVVKGLDQYVTPFDGRGASELLRQTATDWFYLGPVEAVRASLGVGPAAPLLPVQHSLEQRSKRFARAVETVRELRWTGVTADEDEHGVLLHGPSVAVGMAAQRLIALLWTEGLTAKVQELDVASTSAHRAQERTATVRITLADPRDSNHVLDLRSS